MLELDQETRDNLGELVKRLRLAAGMSRSKLAQRSGVCEATIKNIEGGIHFPQKATIISIFGVPGMGLTPDRAKRLRDDPNASVQFELSEGTINAHDNTSNQEIGTVITLRFLLIPRVTRRPTQER